MRADDDADGDDGPAPRQSGRPLDPSEETRTWPELAINLYERLTGRGAEITYEFDDLSVDVPSRTGDDPQYAHWRLNGSLSVRTRDPGDEGNE
jgi:hypothetical protein